MSSVYTSPALQTTNLAGKRLLVVILRSLNSCFHGEQLRVPGVEYFGKDICLRHPLRPHYHGSSSVMEGNDTSWADSKLLMLIFFNLQLIKPISKIKSFRELAIREGFEDLRHGTGIVVVGVDAR
jgi:hypothetical protein